MRRAGPWCLLLAAACALARTPPPPRGAVRCPPAGACFSAHLASVSYAEARGACDQRRGSLAWVSGEPELRLLLGLLADAAVLAPALFWVGLKTKASTCTHEEQPLRGFSWEGVEDGMAPQEVPVAAGAGAQGPCLTARCAGLYLAAWDGPSWGWRERACQLKSPGYLCKYQYEGACPDPSPAGALDLDYLLPFKERSGGPGFSPPGTVLMVACPGGEVRLTCQPETGGFAWKAAEMPLCPCPFGRKSPDSGRCAEAVGCRDATGGFACACTPGGPDGAPCPGRWLALTAAGGPAEPSRARAEGRRPSIPTPGGSTEPPATTTAAVGGEKTAAPPPSSSSLHLLILVPCAVFMVAFALFYVSWLSKKIRECWATRSPGRPAAREAGSAEPSGAAANSPGLTRPRPSGLP